MPPSQIRYNFDIRCVCYYVKYKGETKGEIRVLRDCSMYMLGSIYKWSCSIYQQHEKVKILTQFFLTLCYYIIITFTFKLLVTVSYTNLCTKSCKKTIGMELINKSVTDVTKTEQHSLIISFIFGNQSAFQIKLSLCILIVY